MDKLSINKYLLGLIFIATVCITTYSNCIHNEFLLDDDLLLRNNQSVGPRSLSSLIFEGSNAVYRPLQMIFLKLELQLFGAHPEGFHITNLILFIFVCWIFFYLIFYLFRDYFLALLSCGLFAAHPINNFQVNYCTASGLSINILCTQLSIIFFLKFLDKKKWLFLLGSLLFYSGALLTHLIGLMTPLYLFLILFFVRKPGTKREYLYLIIYVFMFLLFLAVQSQIKGLRMLAPVFQLDISPLSYLATIAKLAFWYISRLVIPKDILFTWAIPIVEEHLLFWNCLVMILFGFVVLSFKKIRDGCVKFSLALFLVGFLQLGITSFSDIFSMGVACIEGHWMYFSSIGFFILIAAFLISLRRIMSRILWLLLLIFIFLSLIISTRIHSAYWKNPGIFCTYWINTNPFNYTPWWELERYYTRLNKSEKLPLVFTSFDHLLDFKKHYLLYIWRGTRYADINQFALAEADYTQALALKPFEGAIYNYRGVVYARSGQYDLALQDCNRAIILDPHKSIYYKNRSEVLLKMGKPQFASQDLSKSRQLEIQEEKQKKKAGYRRKPEL